MKQYDISDCKYTVQNNTLTLKNELFSVSFDGVCSASASEQDGKGLSEKYLEVSAKRENGTDSKYCIWPSLPLVWMPKYSEPYLFKFSGEHWVVKSVKLYAFTDENDTLVTENESHLFMGKLLGERQGEIFLFEDPQSGNAAVVISETADYTTATLTVKDYTAFIDNGQNGLAIGFCRIGECEKLCRDYLKHARKYEKLVTMSNTWGDRNGSSRVCRDFVLKEIDAAQELGIDIVQIDDGWQLGDTAWRSERDEKKRRTFEGDYWICNRERFPDELAPIVQYAAERGILTGMWFAPDSHGTFKHFERDMEVLTKAYREWGIRFFKLDMYWVDNATERDLMLSMLDKLHSLGDDVTVQMDVTRHSRLNYLCGRQYGTVFVENRYTGSGNSFPHRILRNLWMLSRYIPSSRFQFEIVNPDLNTELYSPDDPFAPQLYSMDYLFASVMLSNPLFWMEMQFLSDKRKTELEKVMAVWKEHQKVLAGSDIFPIGQKPSGRSFTGFCVSKDGKATHLLLFREVTESSCAVIEAPVSAAKAKILASNGQCTVEVSDKKVCVDFKEPRSYAFIKIQ